MTDTTSRDRTRSPAAARGPVWIVDADHWPRAYLRAELIERGYDAVGFGTPGDALARRALRAGSPPALVIVDLQGQSPERLAPLLRGSYPVVAIGGAAEWATASLRERPWAAFLRRPVTIGQIADEVDRLLARRPPFAR